MLGAGHGHTAQPILPLPPLFPTPSSTTQPPVPTSPGLPAPTPPPEPTPPPRQPGTEKLPLATGASDTRPTGAVFTLEARSMILTGVRYGGVTPQQTVHLTTDRVEMDGLVHRALAGGQVLTISANGISGVYGRSDLYLEEFTGTLAIAGLPTVPLRLSGASLLTPGLDLSFLALPQLAFTNVTARVRVIRGGDLRVPNAQVRVG